MILKELHNKGKLVWGWTTSRERSQKEVVASNQECATLISTPPPFILILCYTTKDKHKILLLLWINLFLLIPTGETEVIYILGQWKLLFMKRRGYETGVFVQRSDLLIDNDLWPLQTPELFCTAAKDLRPSNSMVQLPF